LQRKSRPRAVPIAHAGKSGRWVRGDPRWIRRNTASISPCARAVVFPRQRMTSVIEVRVAGAARGSYVDAHDAARLPSASCRHPRHRRGLRRQDVHRRRRWRASDLERRVRGWIRRWLGRRFGWRLGGRVGRRVGGRTCRRQPDHRLGCGGRSGHVRVQRGRRQRRARLVPAGHERDVQRRQLVQHLLLVSRRDVQVLGERTPGRIVGRGDHVLGMPGLRSIQRIVVALRLPAVTAVYDGPDG